MIFSYCLAEAAARFDILVLAFSLMSNHYHGIFYDTHGRFPQFLERFHKMVAKCMNCYLERSENFWSNSQTSIVRLRTPADIFLKVVYVLCNPVAADLVDRVVDWKDATSYEYLDGTKTTQFERPEYYFSPSKSLMPITVDLRTVLPESILGGESQTDWAQRVREAVAQREETLRRARRAAQRPVVGWEAALGKDPSEKPTSEVTSGELSPVVASHDREARIAEIGRVVQFRVDHEEARQTYIAKKKPAVFPAGTYRMRLLGATCEPFPPPDFPPPEWLRAA